VMSIELIVFWIGFATALVAGGLVLYRLWTVTRQGNKRGR
jgi:hypothetical protein